MTKYYLAILSLMLIPGAYAFGQGNAARPFVKLYSNFYALKTFRSPLTDYNSEYGIVEFGGFAPAFQWAGKKERKYHEVEWSVLRFKSQEDDIRLLNEREFSIRYEFGKTSRSKKTSGTYWQHGCSFRGFAYFRDSEPLLSSGIPLSQTSIGLVVSYVPRFYLPVTERFQLEANLILGGALYAAIAEFDDPQLPIRQRRTGGFSFDLLQEIPLRIGFSYGL